VDKPATISSQAAEGKEFFGYVMIAGAAGMRYPKAARHCNTANNVLQVFSFVWHPGLPWRHK
jgi:hypothetical protein